MERNLAQLEAELRRLEAEYNMFFAGRLPRPPWETRKRVEALIRQYDRMHIQNYAEKFRFQSLQSRFSSFVDLWDRGLRSREEGRAGPFPAPRTDKADPKKGDVRHVAAFKDPVNEVDKLRDLYHSMSEARREVGAEQIPFNRFADLVKSQVQKMNLGANQEVAFRVSVKDGKVNFTAKVKKPGEE